MKVHSRKKLLDIQEFMIIKTTKKPTFLSAPQTIIHLNQPFSLNREMASIRFPTSSFSRIVEI